MHLELLSSFAVERAAPGHWLVRVPSDDPFLPATVLIAVLREPSYCGHAKRSAHVIRYPPPHAAKTRADFGTVSWRDDLLQLARVIDTLSPDRDNPEAFCIKKNAVSHELRRLAKWRPPS
jgi:hypothetical protein